VKYYAQTYIGCCLVALILSPAIGTAAFAAEAAFIDTNDPTGAPGILRLPPGHPYRFNVDSARSQIVVTAEVMGREDNDVSPVAGWLDITLAPGQSPFSTIHTTDLDLQLTEQIDLSYGLLGWAKGTGIGVNMNQPGPTAAIQIDDSFIQTSNYLAARGLFEYSFILVGSGSVDLATMDPVASDLTGFIWQDWTTITLQMDIDIEYPLEVDGSAVGTAWIQGTIVATAEVFWAAADLYSDGLVNFRDFAVFAAAWDTSPGDPAYNPECDLDQPLDGFIDAADLAVFADYWLCAAE
jgi:hypothetical protein